MKQSTGEFFIGQKAFIINEEKVLILKRNKSDGLSGMWDFPGGRLDFGESLSKGLRREVLEESGLEILKISSPLSITTFFPLNNRSKQTIRIIYLCKASGKVKLSKEHNEYKWIAPGSFLDYDYPDSDYNTAFEKFIREEKNYEEFLGNGILKESQEYLNSQPSD